MPYLPIHEYGLIGDMNSCALVSSGGSIDWACFPRFDSPSVFAAVLDDAKGGRCSLSGQGTYSARQRYLPDTTVLETLYEAEHGAASVCDFMTRAPARSPDAPHEIIRMIEGVRGSIGMRLVFQPRLDYARGETTLSVTRNGVLASHPEGVLALVSDLPFTIEPAGDGGEQAVAEFTVREGERVEFTLAFGLRRLPSISTMDCRNKLERAMRHDEASVAKLGYSGYLRDEVVRSYLTLHMLIFEPTGAIVAAPTTSLPESLGGVRNWDYRYSWLRDSAWTLGILYRLGDPHEGEAFIDWVVDQCAMSIESMQILFGIAPESELEELELDHLEGYARSSPVRIGNGAAFHRQLDVFGEVALSLAVFHRYSGNLSDKAWGLLKQMADLAAEMWHMEDRGIWEVRGPEQHFVYSKVMCWVALDRAVKLAEGHGFEGDIEHWRRQRDLVREEVLDKGWSDSKRSFVQAYGSEAVDASALLIPFLGFLPPDDPRIRTTVRRIQMELSDGPFVRRYRVEDTDDGLVGEEGAFYILSFWLIGALMTIGETQEALTYFNKVFATANHLGLFAEMHDPITGQALGNFPQAFSHIGFIHTAKNINEMMRSQTYEEELQA
ncbi:MAG: glycoside hydrolase family 15 protein [Chloroflexi bacterium]|nr:glycoside hydrolase family 15 protein [Chloroflexota bacterium]